MSMLNIVIHMLFASTAGLSVEREVEDKITLWCQQEKSSNEHLNKFPVNCRWHSTIIGHSDGTVAAGHLIERIYCYSDPQKYGKRNPF